MKFFTVTVLVLMHITGAAMAQECINYEDYLHLAGEIDTPGIGMDVVVCGDYAYLAAYDAGLQVIDISNPEGPQIIGSVGTPGHAQGVAISGSLAYVADGTPGLQVIDISNPADPSFVGTVEIPGVVECVAIQEEYALVAGGDVLHVLDISDPYDIQVLGIVEYPGSVCDIAISGSFAYVANGFGLQIIDFSIPEIPQAVGSVETPEIATGVAVSGDYAYVTAYHPYITSGFQVINISDPQNPWIVAENVAGVWRATFYKVTISGNYAYFSVRPGWEGVLGWAGLQTFDISSPESPQLVGSCQFGLSTRVAISGHHAFGAVGGSCGLQVIDITNPASPPISGILEVPGFWLASAISGTYLFMSAEEDSVLQVVDIGDPENPHIVTSVNTSGDIREMVVSGNHAYMVDGDFQVMDISNPVNPLSVANFATPGQASGLAVSGDLALVIDGADDGVQVVDISNPAIPLIIGNIPGDAKDVAVWENQVCLLVEECLQVFDISNPDNPQFQGSVDMPGNAISVTLSGSLAYVTGGYMGIQIVDISTVQIVENMPLAGRSYFVTVSGAYAYVYEAQPRGGYSTLSVVSLSGQTPTRVIGGVRLPFACENILTSGDNICIPGRGGIQILPAQCDQPTGIDDDDLEPEPVITPAPMVGLSVFPNPFNPRTMLSFTIDTPQEVKLCIYNLTGGRVATLADGAFQAGTHRFQWQGIDQKGRAVASGIYLVRMVGDFGVVGEKITLVR